MTKQKKTAGRHSLIAALAELRQRGLRGFGAWALIASLLALSFLVGANFEPAPRMYVAGQIADKDITAVRDILVEDSQATLARKKQVMSRQPPVYDFSMEPFSQFQARIADILRSLSLPGSEPDSALRGFTEEISQPVADEVLPELAEPAVQSYILKNLLPLIRDQLADGLVWDIRAARVGNAGIILRNLDTGAETLKPDARSLTDAQSFLAEIAAKIRQEPSLNAQSRRAINILLAATLPASLTLNREATQRRGADVVASVAPVFYQIQKGEVVLRKGERVSREQQIKLQALYDSAESPLRWPIVSGAFLCSLIMGAGFFISPAGKRGRPLERKDMLLIAVILLLFGIGAKCVYLFGLRMDSIGLLNALAFAFPAAGAVALTAMVFAARRYCTMGLLLAFFCMVMFNGGYQLFFFYFLGAMLATWLALRAQNRQDVVWSGLPLAAGLLLIYAACGLLGQSPLAEWPLLVLAVLLNALLSLIILFAMSPVLELVFGYSTRFRLMELMSLEQPLMQEIMVTIPGTYHHSLVVSNMVEAGARAIGANSLLCKVAALYHDAGKLSYPEYFIENQFGAPNKHDR
ncbi:MAG: HDIG domain-containing protein, partial [Desulfovibrio sp.]|nr:HDIG domain-containing protein [Desulfovibrio sp.]